MSTAILEPWDHETFVAQLRAVGMTRYHHLHPFHQAMNRGALSPEQIRAWIVNRFYYQQHIPMKDAAIIANCPLPEVRRLWLHRISDHDGEHEDEGGIAAWLKLAEASGLSREEVLSGQHVLPGVRFAVDAYVTFARQQPWPLAVASSLTELFSPDLMSERLAAFERYYTWISPEGLAYFRARLQQAPRDAAQALELTVRYCTTRQLQEGAVQALAFKCDVLWSMLDALQFAYGPLPGEPALVAASTSAPTPTPQEGRL
ncbi:MAG: pyrroloquinoline-quinone synthase PqqC [Thermogemmatispora sp.]|uniref:pyrroloquinoline-quinone synthase PqqC n=1 Tax=Thermogemmatispora sp. TaxID=1968838 RepID=UPI0019EBA0ED|nr:pyrroloquinoline-quinone synthase PqqC [Thermogemmatispora sp.]MBE3566732.1 pyrroloquinoline-quinone synthase PqqC [Thermogemmatispora sp.]